jgi:hypothetical protein
MTMGRRRAPVIGPMNKQVDDIAGRSTRPSLSAIATGRAGSGQELRAKARTDRERFPRRRPRSDRSRLGAVDPRGGRCAEQAELHDIRRQAHAQKATLMKPHHPDAPRSEEGLRKGGAHAPDRQHRMGLRRHRDGQEHPGSQCALRKHRIARRCARQAAPAWRERRQPVRIPAEGATLMAYKAELPAGVTLPEGHRIDVNDSRFKQLEALATSQKWTQEAFSSVLGIEAGRVSAAHASARAAPTPPVHQEPGSERGASTRRRIAAVTAACSSSLRSIGGMD